MSGLIQENAVVGTALRRPVTMMMVLLSALVLGVIALVRIPLELIPSGFSPPFLSVQVPYANATARDIEDKITKPLEQMLSTTPSLDELSSTSSSGSSRITMVFKGDTDMDLAYREVRDRIARVRPELPDDVERITLQKQSGAGIPVAFYGITWDEGVPDPYDTVHKSLVRAIERIDGVGVVDLWGQEDPQIQIEVNRTLADAANLNLAALVQRLGGTNFTLASGAIEDGGEELLVRSVASYGSIAELENLIVAESGMRLKDVAKVGYARPERERYDRYNGKPSMVMFVIKESQANTVEVCERIKQAVDEVMKEPALRQFQIDPVFIQGDTILFSLRQVVTAGLQGGGLALLVLLFFLRRFRLTLFIAFSIPLSLFLSLPVMYFTGQTINLVSLIGLMICVGLVVDNSLVIAENIERYRARGLGPYAAALQGAGEMALALTLATTTTMVVFLPASLLSSGPTQFFLIRMVTPVCVSLLASLFVALILIPIASATVLAERERKVRERPGSFYRALARIEDGWKRGLEAAYESTIGRLNRGYVRLLRVCLRRRTDVVLVSLLALASIAIPARSVEFVAGQSFGTRHVNVYYSMPSDTELEEAHVFFRKLEQLIEQHKQELNIDGYYVGFDANFAQFQVFFNPPREDDPPFKELGKKVVELLPTPAGWEKNSRFGESDGAKDDTFMVSIYGDEHDVVQAVKTELEAQIVRVEGVIGLENRGQDSRRRDELALSIERAMAERFGIPPTVIANTVSYAIRGANLPRYRANDKEIDVKVRYRKQDREDLSQLLAFKVQNASGQQVPIQVLADKEIELAEASLVRNDKRVAALVRVDIDPKLRMETMTRIQQFLASYRLPEGVSFDADHEGREVDETMRDLAGAALLGTVFIFLLMGFLFESFVLPISVLPSIPLSFVGVWWFLYLTGETIDPLAGIGIILLLGVVVNNAIVLVDFINTARAAGLSRVEAIVQAGKLRFRPILMTALTTVGGMLPMAFAEQTGEGIPYNAFGKALVGGMTTSTILTLVVVPVAYTFLDDLREFSAEWYARLRRVVSK